MKVDSKAKIVAIVVMLVLAAVIFAFGGKTSGKSEVKTQDPNSHCEQMKNNPECFNQGKDANCKCVREPDENGNCPQEGQNCISFCCRNKCKCIHPKCTLAMTEQQKHDQSCAGR